MEGKKFIESIRLENILSYGLNTEAFPLEPLNVLIGPNASGKSNLIEVLSLLAAAPRDLQGPIREGGGVREWIWKGTPNSATATVEVTLAHPNLPLRYLLSFMESWPRFQLVDEVVEDERPRAGQHMGPHFYYRYRHGDPILNVAGSDSPRHLGFGDTNTEQSILSQLRDPGSYPQLWNVGFLFQSIAFYREWKLGRAAPARLPQRPDLYQAVLLEDASNLGLVLSDLLNQPPIKEQILGRMQDFYPWFRDVNVTVSGGTVQIFFEETGLRRSVPATRLSDGSLRYLSLLAVLCHPNPPRVICVEEPELGLHPDVIPEVAKLLVDAASRSQIFITTHSDMLVDALTDVPESIVVCEKSDGATKLRRLDIDELEPWLIKYRLGELWSRGQIGGNRW